MWASCSGVFITRPSWPLMASFSGWALTRMARTSSSPSACRPASSPKASSMAVCSGPTGCSQWLMRSVPVRVRSTAYQPFCRGRSVFWPALRVRSHSCRDCTVSAGPSWPCHSPAIRRRLPVSPGRLKAGMLALRMSWQCGSVSLYWAGRLIQRLTCSSGAPGAGRSSRSRPRPAPFQSTSPAASVWSCPALSRTRRPPWSRRVTHSRPQKACAPVLAPSGALAQAAWVARMAALVWRPIPS